MNDQLREKTKSVMRSIALLPNKPAFARQADGEAAIVIALPNEYVGDVMKRIPNNSGPVNLVVASAKHFEVITMSRSGQEDGVISASHQLSVGMLMIKLKSSPGKSMKLNVGSQGSSTQEVTLLPQLAYA